MLLGQQLKYQAQLDGKPNTGRVGRGLVRLGLNRLHK